MYWARKGEEILLISDAWVLRDIVNMEVVT